MNQRIEKKEHFEYWQVESSEQTHKDRKEEESSHQDQFSHTKETTDWNLFLDKSRLWDKNIQVLREEISKIVFQKINLKTDPSLLRVVIHLVGGGLISPAFVSIARNESLKLKHLTPGAEIDPNSIIRSKTLQVMVPTNPEQFLAEEKRLQKRPQTPFIALSEDTTTVIKPKIAINKTFSLWDAQTGKLRFDVLTLYIVTHNPDFFIFGRDCLVNPIVWLLSHQNLLVNIFWLKKSQSAAWPRFIKPKHLGSTGSKNFWP